ncbi:RHS repeat protein [Acinetobacter wuhouensis]|uniref:RHS repeat-associated core domain-containing protein n=1 Tax=Acinetobacter wuhouensis TaxID=1879050 RepID=UPI0010230518|nr:RHS repeat-associated core domain-containing protein [Acinetobacter wuhouensis]RZG75199.1 RHS repeat protein [Acinetobacter wuhouensis]
MALIDNSRNSETENTTVGTNNSAKGQTNQNQAKPAVELAVFNLASVTHTEDHKFIAHQIESYLKQCGHTSLEQIQSAANVPTVANIFALSGSVLDLILFATEAKKEEAGVQQAALMSMNLIGLFLQPNAEAHVRMALRPLLGLMAECLYPDNGKIKEADIRRMTLHLNAQMAGDLEKFLKETQGKLPTLLSSATTLGISILTAFSTPISGGIVSPTINLGATAEKRDPKEQFSNWAKPLIDLIGTPAQSDMSSKMEIPKASFSQLQKESAEALTTLTTVIQQQSNAGTKYSLAWLIQETLKAIKAQGNKASASVPLNQTGEHEQHTRGDTLEFLTLQADALNNPPCTGKDFQSGNSISYSIGAERINHSDFYLPKVGFAFSRQYNSQMNEFDHSMIGARWMMPFSNVIIQNKSGYLFIDSNGRKHQLPESIIYEEYVVPYEGFVITPHTDGDLLLNFGSEWNFHFHSFNGGKHYHVVQQFNEKTNEKVVLTYLLFEQFAYLQAIDFQLKRGKHIVKFAFNDQAKVIAAFVDDQAEALARYEYDPQGNLTKAIDQNGHTRSYEYNNAHQLTRYTDRTGRGQNIRYNSTEPKAKAIAEWADDGSFKTRLEWHPRLRQVAVYDAYDVPTYYYFDLDGFTYRTRLADGREKWLSRDSQKRITRQIDFTGLEREHYYNKKNQLAKVSQTNGGIILFAYDDAGNLTEIKDPEGNIWKTEYNADGNVSKEINPLGHTTQYKYNNDNQIVEIIDAKGGSKKIQYNDFGQMVSYSDCSGKENAWQYDDEGTLLAQASADAKAIQYIYSTKGKDKGQLQAIIYPDGLKEQFSHDEEGRLLKHIDTKGLITQYRYNKIGLVEQRVDANQHQIGYQWDKQGRIQKLINQNRAEYLFDYNRFGQLIHEQAFDGEEKHYSYSENGQLFQIRQPNILTQFSYHKDGSIASKTYTHLQTRHSQTEEFEYNLNNQLSQAKNQESQIDFFYNAIGELIREHQTYKVPNSKSLTAVLRYEYDELGNLSKTIRPDGQVQTNLSYGSGHIYGIAFNQQDMVAFQRDDLHRETVRMLANGLIQTKNYNDVGLLSSQIIRPEQETTDQLQQAKHQAERNYQYENNYLLTQVNDSRLGKLNYQYDSIGRLIKTQSLYTTENFTFDPAGNLIDPIATQTSQVKNNLITQYQGKYYKYDAQGNVVETTQAGKTLKLTWDNLNRLIQSDNNGQITTYGYDIFGRRLFKNSQNSTNSTNSGLTLFGWDGDLMVWESYQSSRENPENNKNYTKHYVYEPNNFVPLFQTGYVDFIKLIETPDYSRFQNEPYSIYKDPVWNTETRKNKAELERVAFYHCDQVGTPQTLSNELGECVWEIKQDTWGTALEINTSENLLEQTNLRFQGQYYDSETGLHYNRYRYYEPYSARYVSKDPIGLLGGLNNSVYVSDPNQWIDPMGLMASEQYYDFNKINRELDEKRNQDYLKAIDKRDSTTVGKLNKWAKDKLNTIKEGHKNFPNNSNGAGRDHELDHINRVEQCTINQQCSIDYMTCSASVIDINESIAINLHNGNLYAGTTLSIEQVRKIYMLKNTPVSLRKSKFGFKGSVSCILYSIRNIPKSTDRGLAVDTALEGLSLSGGGSYGILQGGIDKSLTDPEEMFEKDKETGKIKLTDKQKKAPFAVGMGIGFGGGLDAGIGIMKPIGNIKDLFK